jgi:hypothetical protein
MPLCGKKSEARNLRCGERGELDETRLRALARLLGVIHGCIFEIESRQPPPPKTDPKAFVEIYI